MTIAYLDWPRDSSVNKPLRASELARPLRRPRPSPSPARSRLYAILITVVAHVVAITTLVEGLRQANVFHRSEIVTVQIDLKKQKPQDLPPPAVTPVLIQPSVITAPVPMFSIAPPDPMVAVAPSTPKPPVAASVPSATSSQGAITWQGLLLARLEQAKHYPLSAQARRQQGVVLLHFTMDRQGRVLSASIQKSSGFEALDQESLAMVQRAQPLPAPPPEVTGNPIGLDVPVEFFLNKRN